MGIGSNFEEEWEGEWGSFPPGVRKHLACKLL